MFKFEIKINDKDYWNFLKYHCSSNVIDRLFMLLVVVMPAIGLFVNFWNAYPKMDNLLYITLFVIVFGMISLLVGIILGIIVALFSNLSLKTYVRLMRRFGTMPYSPEQVLEFRADDFTDMTSDSESTIKYYKIKKIGINKKAVYLYINAMEAYIIPISYFADKEHKKQFLMFVREKCSY